MKLTLSPKLLPAKYKKREEGNYCQSDLTLNICLSELKNQQQKRQLPGGGAHPSNPSTREAEVREAEASLVYRASSRPAKAL